MITLTAPISSLFVRDIQRRTFLWHIGREDGTDYYFTDHDRDLDYLGDTYTPIGGLEVSAEREKTGLGAPNREALGLLTDSAISDTDLWAGKFNLAEVNEAVVDWKYPWAGYAIWLQYWLTNIAFNGSYWSAEIFGLQAWLTQKVGREYELHCPYEVGDSDCGVNLATYTQSSVVVSTVLNKYSFTATTGSLPTSSDDYYKDGLVTWTTGDNAGLTQKVKQFTNSTRFIECYQSAPFDIEAGDTFSISRGCNKLLNSTNGDCELIYLNHLNYGGNPWMSNTNILIKTPPV